MPHKGRDGNNNDTHMSDRRRSERHQWRTRRMQRAASPGGRKFVSQLTQTSNKSQKAEPRRMIPPPTSSGVFSCGLQGVIDSVEYLPNLCREIRRRTTNSCRSDGVVSASCAAAECAGVHCPAIRGENTNRGLKTWLWMNIGSADEHRLCRQGATRRTLLGYSQPSSAPHLPSPRLVAPPIVVAWGRLRTQRREARPSSPNFERLRHIR